MQAFKKNNANLSDIYSLYADFSIQLNAKFNDNYELDTLAVKAHSAYSTLYVIIDKQTGIDSFRHESHENFINSQDQEMVKIDYFSKNLVTVESINIKLFFTVFHVKAIE